jgi:acetyl-CoA carboxylase carboxyl transferase subunit beta
MSWFSRQLKSINTRNKKEVPEGIWHQCSSCKKTISVKEHNENLYTCHYCNHHDTVPPNYYLKLIFDDKSYQIQFDNIRSKDFLNFTDVKSYQDRLDHTIEETGETDAIKVATGKVNGYPLTIAAMNFRFIGGSMGSVVGERICKAIDYCIEHQHPLLIISQSGGARMMESAFSLMQMAKTSAKLTQLAAAKQPYFSLMTDPTTGGTTASFSMLGDINMGEPDALIGFAGPRVIKNTIQRDLPNGFQRSEFLIEKGFLDLIVHRKDLKTKLTRLLSMFGSSNIMQEESEGVQKLV